MRNRAGAKRAFDALFDQSTPTGRPVDMRPAPAPKPKLELVPAQPSQRATTLVGRLSATDLSICTLDELIAIKQIPQSVVQEVRDIEKRRLAGDIDNEKDYANAAVRFQEYQFDPALRGANPQFELSNPRFNGRNSSKGKQKGPSHGMDADGNPIDAHTILFNGLSSGTGMSVFVPVIDPGQHGPRPRTPWWILNGHIFQEFLRSIVDSEDDLFLKGDDLFEAAGLDYKILVEYYLRRKEDKEIFFDHRKEFKTEKRRQRITSSAAAVKMRRKRLKDAGNGEYGQDARPIEGPEHSEHLAIWADIRFGPAIRPHKGKIS